MRQKIYHDAPRARLAALAAVLLLRHYAADAQRVVSFDPATARDAANLRALTFVSRVTVPYGPDLLRGQTSDNKPWTGYGFGVGAGENVAYDHRNRYLYVSNQQGYATIVDYADPARPYVTDYGLDYRNISLIGEGNDIAVCPDRGWVFIAVKSRGVVLQIAALQRSHPRSPRVIQEIAVDDFPRQLLVNSDCSLLVVSNENADELTIGTVTLVRQLDTRSPYVTIVPMDAAGGWDDAYTLSKGLHMPLSRNALEYWDDYSHLANQLNFSHVRANYRSSIFLEAETLAWANPEETELLVNLQINNGLLRLDVANNKAVSLASYGLKDHGTVPIDVNSEDGACRGRTYTGLFSMRNPDSVRVLHYHDRLYLLTANEGDNKEYFGFEDQIAAADLFQDQTFALRNMDVDATVFDPNMPLGGSVAAPFNANCTGSDCVGKVKISVGSSAIDYQLDPSNPTFQRMVLFGGRGFTIYELPEDPEEQLELIYDSADDMERISCEKLPWAYNSLHTDEYAPANNMRNNTAYRFGDAEVKQILEDNNDPLMNGCSDQGDGTPGACPMRELADSTSSSLGPTVEALVTGVACGRLVAVMSSGLSSVAWLYDITEIAFPRMVQIFHLSPASRRKSPGLAYNEGELGEIDAENIIFLSAEESPSGKAAVIFGGSHSGTFSFWEFECGKFQDVVQSAASDAASAAMSHQSVVRAFRAPIFAAAGAVLLSLL